MKSGFVILSVVILAFSANSYAGPQEDVAAATEAWVKAMNAHNDEQVAALYDSDAVLWGTRSPTLRDSPAAIKDYFKILRTADPSYKVVIGKQRIRVYGDVAINTGSYTFSEVHDGRDVGRPSRFSFVFHYRDGRWLIVDHHSSAIPTSTQ